MWAITLKILFPVTLSEFGLGSIDIKMHKPVLSLPSSRNKVYLFMFSNSIALYFKVSCIAAVVTPGYLVQRVMAMVLVVVC